MKKSAASHAVHWLITAAFLALCLLLLQEILRDKYFGDGGGIVESFYQQTENSQDVIFLGSSNMFCTISPRQMMEENGIKGWNFGSSSQPIPLTELYLNLALERQTPKVVVVEVLKFPVVSQTTQQQDYWSLVVLPLSKEKLLWLKEREGGWSGTLPWLFTLPKFHSRWDSIDVQDFAFTAKMKQEACQGFIDERGFLRRDEAVPQSRAKAGEVEEFNSLPEENIEICKRMIVTCQNRGIEVVFFKAPVADNSWSVAKSEAISQFAEEQGMPFIDYNDAVIAQQIGLDDSTDFFNAGHVNSSGAAKVTRHLGQFLKENYLI